MFHLVNIEVQFFRHVRDTRPKGINLKRLLMSNEQQRYKRHSLYLITVRYLLHFLRPSQSSTSCLSQRTASERLQLVVEVLRIATFQPDNEQ